MTTRSQSPKRGEIWEINLAPTLGAEIRKTRPAVVVSSDSLGRLPIRLIAPITEWNDSFGHDIWHVRVEPTSYNGLYKVSAVDALQLRAVDVQRFLGKLGRLSASLMREIVAAVAAVIEYE